MDNKQTIQTGVYGKEEFLVRKFKQMTFYGYRKRYAQHETNKQINNETLKNKYDHI